MFFWGAKLRNCTCRVKKKNTITTSSLWAAGQNEEEAEEEESIMPTSGLTAGKKLLAVYNLAQGWGPLKIQHSPRRRFTQECLDAPSVVHTSHTRNRSPNGQL